MRKLLSLCAITGCVMMGSVLYAEADETVKPVSDVMFSQELDRMVEENDRYVTKRQAENNEYLSKRLIIKSSDTELIPSEYGAIDAIQDRDGHYIMQFETSRDARLAQKELAKEDSVEYVEPDIYMFPCYYGIHEAVDNEMPDWGIAYTGSDVFSQYLVNKKKTRTVNVAVLDSGLNTAHNAVAGRLDTTYSCNITDKTNDIVDGNGHGTFISGIISASTKGLEDITITPVKLLDANGNCTVSSCVTAINYMAGQNKSSGNYYKRTDVISLSVVAKIPSSSSTANSYLKEYIGKAAAAGTTVVVSAGNDNEDTAAYMPSNITDEEVSGCIIVGASTMAGGVASFSNYGDSVDISAPGQAVKSAYYTGNNTYATSDGTSFSAPYVAAAAAMLLLDHPEYTPGEIENVLESQASSFCTANARNYGNGILNLASLVPGGYQNYASEVQSVIELIKNLDKEITLEDELLINEAEEAYESLPAEAKEYVSNYELLTKARTALDEIKEDTQAAEETDSLIEELGDNITLEDEDRIKAARARYDSLTEKQKTYVARLSELEAAEEAIETIKQKINEVITLIENIPDPVKLSDEGPVNNAWAAYNVLPDDLKKHISNAQDLINARDALNELKAGIETAQRVDDMIGNLNENLTLEDEESVVAIRAEYESLTIRQRTLVTRQADLEAAEEKIAQLKLDKEAAYKVENEIARLDKDITLNDEDAITHARASYENLSEERKALVSNVSILEEAEENLEKLKENYALAATVSDMIKNLPADITAGCEEQVLYIRKAYDDLTQQAKEYVDNIADLEYAERVIAKIKEDNMAASAVVDLIAALPDQITLYDENSVQQAESAYESLSQDQKNLVTNLAKLEKAKSDIQRLRADADAAHIVEEKIGTISFPVNSGMADSIYEIKRLYDNLTGDQKNLVPNYSSLEKAVNDLGACIRADEDAASAVCAKITALPDSITSGNEQEINAARDMYNSLTPQQKTYVTNLQKLADAEKKLAECKKKDQEAAESIMGLIESIGSPAGYSDEGAISTARSAYNKLTDIQKSLVSNYSRLQNAEKELASLKEKDNNAANAVIEAIAALPQQVTIKDAEAIATARGLYNSLTSVQKSKVTNLQVLERKEKQIDSLKKDIAAAETVETAIKSIPSTVTLRDESLITKARGMYNALTAAQRSRVSNYSELVKAENALDDAKKTASSAGTASQQAASPAQQPSPAEATTNKEEAKETEKKAGTEAPPAIQISEPDPVPEEETAPSTSIGTQETELQAQAAYTGTNPHTNVDYRVPLRKGQKTSAIKIEGLSGGDTVLEWSSSNNKVAAVNGRPDGTCVIKAGKKTGNAVITAVTASSRTITINIKVQKKKVVTKKVRVLEKTVMLRAGESAVLPAQAYPITTTSKAKYKVRNKAVAYISRKGIITGKRPGKTVLEIKSGSKKAKINIIVTAA